MGRRVQCLEALGNSLQVQDVEAAGSGQHEQWLGTEGSLQEVQWLQAADTRQRMGRLETAGKAQWRTGATAAVGWMEAEAEVPSRKSGVENRVVEGQLPLGASAGVQPV